MNRIERLIQKYCPNGVEFKALGDVCKIKTGEAVSKSSIQANQGNFPVINSGREPLGFINRFNTNNDPIGITSRGAGVGFITWCSGKYYRGNLNYSCTILNRNTLNVRYLYFLLLHSQPSIQNLATHEGIPALNKSNLEKLKIPLPPLKVQEEIAAILDRFTQLEAELETRKKQYHYYREQLLGFSDKKQTRFVTLSEICQIKNGYTPSKNCQNYWTDGNIPWFRMDDLRQNGRILNNSLLKVTKEAVKGGELFPPNSIIIATSATIGEHALISVPYLCNQRFSSLTIKSEFRKHFHIKFIFYYCFLLAEWCRNNTTKSSFASVDMNGFRKFPIPLPSLPEQERIIAILDRFDALVNDISHGLPAEIKARRQQYEYYRDRLLTFKEAVKVTQENLTFEDLFSTSAIEMIATSDESTLVGKFEPSAHKREAHQSEDELEKTFIRQLQDQGYEFLRISTEADLIQNLRLQLEKLNKFQFTDLEWEDFFKNKLSRPNTGILEKTKMLQLENTAQILEGEDGYDRNVHLIDKKNLHRNKLQVINQYRSEGEKRSHRYDVTILLNGFPIAHVELKRRGVAIRQAFNQINRYQRESFWEGSGLFQYVQLFVISNGTDTKYYSNTTRLGSIEAQNKAAKHPNQSSNSFAFTSNWADFHNKNILDLEDFTKTFFAKHTLLNVLTKYCVLDAQNRLLVMRPYQIAATEQILSRIKTAANNPHSKNAKTGGYIWHTTGSGKTLTSFKAAQLACKMDEIDKVLFVVDRKDLDYQTMKEYDRFEKGAANANTSTKILKEQLEKPSAKIIVTTIQKLSHFIKSDKNHPIKQQKIALIFDECHRSQFGDMHRDITKFFKHYHLFGFTGTPIFNLNQKKGGNPNIATTMQVFGDRLHAYTIVDAIKDKNVLGFKVSYHGTVKKAYETEDEAPTKENEEILLASERISQITTYILENFQTKTYRNKSYKYEAKRRTGFNAIFATASIKAARLYYEEFKRQQENLPSDKKIKNRDDLFLRPQ